MDIKKNNVAAKTKSPAEKAKQSELAKIHIAKKALGMDDDTYRDMLKRIIAENPAKYLSIIGKTTAKNGATSAKYLTVAGRAEVLEHLRKAGFEGSKSYKSRPHNIDSESVRAGQLKKIEAQLADAGRPWAYAIAIASRMYKKDKLEFCSVEELTGIISGLTRNAEREGRKSRG